MKWQTWIKSKSLNHVWKSLTSHNHTLWQYLKHFLHKAIHMSGCLTHLSYNLFLSIGQSLNLSIFFYVAMCKRSIQGCKVRVWVGLLDFKWVHSINSCVITRSIGYQVTQKLETTKDEGGKESSRDSKSCSKTSFYSRKNCFGHRIFILAAWARLPPGVTYLKKGPLTVSQIVRHTIKEISLTSLFFYLTEQGGLTRPAVLDLLDWHSKKLIWRAKGGRVWGSTLTVSISWVFCIGLKTFNDNFFVKNSFSLFKWYRILKNCSNFKY